MESIIVENGVGSILMSGRYKLLIVRLFVIGWQKGRASIQFTKQQVTRSADFDIC
jgi:hypothetical protein